MKFIKTGELRPGMRLAKPIYNKNGVLLYDRNSKLTLPGINSVKNFGLIGIYILEPAEPVPPLSQEDLEFEQRQTIYMFRLRECLECIVKRRKMENLPALLTDIIRHYGALDHRVNFNQNLRSSEDFMYKHAISVAILTAMLTSRAGFSTQKQMTVVCASLLYDIGYLNVPKPVLEKGQDLGEGDREIIQQSLERGLSYLSMYQNDFEFFPKALSLMQAYIYSTSPTQGELKPEDDLRYMVQLLRVADRFDQMTAMNLNHTPESEIMAMRELKKHPQLYHPDIVETLAECIHIVPQAASVDLSTGDKGIVLAENPKDFMRPVILRISNNEIYDLSIPSVYREIQIVDIMKTMDNRIAVDQETLKHFIPDERLKEITSQFRRKLTQYQ